MGIAELITAGALLLGAVTTLVRELRGIKQMSRAELIGRAEELAWRAVETTKRIRPSMSREEIWQEFRREVLKYLTGKGVNRITEKEWAGMRDTAELLTHAAKSAFGALNKGK